jgi:N-acetylglucosamine-6-phosphate deacetylase
LSIAAQRVLTPGGLVGPAVVELDGEHIAGIRAVARGAAAPDRVLMPGLVDLQVNGIDDVDVAHASGPAWAALDHALLAQGVTTWCPTLVTAPLGSYPAALARVAEAADRPTGVRPAIAGVHLEGPFLGGAPGAHPMDLLRPIDLNWLAGLPPIVRVVTLAPELAGAVDAVRLLAARGVLVALGHSTASYEQSVAAAAAGARLVTHVFNGMGPLHHRQPGLVGAAIAHADLTPSLIADLVHVHPAVVATVLRATPTVLVTDAVAWRAARVSTIGIEFRDGAPRLPDGRLAGSALTMDAAIRNAVGTGVDLETVLTAASSRPAALLGLADRGVIKPGGRADLVALTRDLAVEQVWVGGRSALPSQ